MQRRQLKKMVDSLGLQLLSFENGTGNGANIVLKAPDGYEAKFMVSRLNDPNSESINRAQFRRFARDHNPSQTLPGIDEIDMQLNGMQRAMIAAHEAVPAHAIKVVKKVLEHQPLLNPEAIIRNAMAHPEMDADPVQCWVSDKPKPTLHEDPINEPVEDIDALISNHPTDLVPMPRKLTLATPVTTDDTPKPKRKQVMRIGQVEFFKLCNVLNEIDMVGINSYPKLAEKLTKAYGKPVAITTAEDACKATGKRLDKVVVEATDAQVIIARSLMTLLVKLSEPVPDDLRKLCGEIE